MQPTRASFPKYTQSSYNSITKKKNQLGRRTKQTLLQRRCTDDQAFEKMLNISNFLRNANQNYNEVPPHNSQKGHHEKYLQITDAGEGVEKRNASYTVDRNVN